jgi:hypothetical protein
MKPKGIRQPRTANGFAISRILLRIPRFYTVGPSGPSFDFIEHNLLFFAIAQALRCTSYCFPKEYLPYEYSPSTRAAIGALPALRLSAHRLLLFSEPCQCQRSAPSDMTPNIPRWRPTAGMLSRRTEDAISSAALTIRSTTHLLLWVIAKELRSA